MHKSGIHSFRSINDHIKLELKQLQIIVESTPNYCGIHSKFLWNPLQILVESTPNYCGIHSKLLWNPLQIIMESTPKLWVE